MRPILTMCANSFAFFSSASCRCASAGMSRCVISSTAAICIAVGKQSFEDWLILTWSLGCTGAFCPRLPPSISLAAVGDHLVDVHVGLRAGSGLPHQQWKMIVEFSVHHLLRRPRYGLGALLVEGAQPMVDLGRRMFDEA